MTSGKTQRTIGTDTLAAEQAVNARNERSR
jgi:hypothetical protein